MQPVLSLLRGSCFMRFADRRALTSPTLLELMDFPVRPTCPAEEPRLAHTSYRADAQAQGLELVTVTLAQTLTPKLKTRAILPKQSCSTELQSDDKNGTTFIASQPNHSETTRKARETHLSSSDHVPPSILVHPCKPCARHVYMRLHVF